MVGSARTYNRGRFIATNSYQQDNIYRVVTLRSDLPLPSREIKVLFTRLSTGWDVKQNLKPYTLTILDTLQVLSYSSWMQAHEALENLLSDLYAKGYMKVADSRSPIYHENGVIRAAKVLYRIGQAKRVTTYGELEVLSGVFRSHECSKVLSVLSRATWDTWGFAVSALVTSANTTTPSIGFFSFYEELTGNKVTTDPEELWESEVTKVWDALENMTEEEFLTPFV